MFARVALVTVLGLTGTLLACGGDDDAGTDTTTDPTTETTTDMTTSVATTTVPTSAATTVPMPELDSVLLTASEVGDGWQLGPEVTEADFGDAMQIPCLDTLLNPVLVARLTPTAGVQFEPVDGSSRHLIEFALTGEPGRLATDLDGYFGAMDACVATTSAERGDGSLTVERLALPELGEQSAGFVAIGVQSPDVTWYVRTADVRVGSVAIQLGLTEILSTPDDQPSTSDAEFVQLLETATAKLTS